jgi:DNA-binding NarL/FixJ family response regulator
MEEIMTSNIYVSLIAQPGRFRESIQILLTSISQISEVFPTESVKETLSLAEIITPAIVILDSQAINHDLPSALKMIGDTWQKTSRIVLVEDKNELQQATAHGADLVLMKGFNASMFISEIEKILKNR